MTNELKIEKTSKIETLKATLQPMYEAQEKRNLEINSILTKEMNTILNPVFPIGADIACEGARFYTVVEALKKESKFLYADFGSEINIYNQYSWLRDIEKMYESFNPELAASGIRMKFTEEDTDITKIQIMNFLAQELTNFYTEKGSKFVTKMVGYFAELRKMQKEISTITGEISSIERELNEAKKSEEMNAIVDAFKEGNWYSFDYNPLHTSTTRFNKSSKYDVYFHIRKISPKTISVDIYKHEHIKQNWTTPYESKRVQLEELYVILKNGKLLTESPMKAEMA